ncbi:SusC/RagA family TonB-linked outer membrane protein [Fulvivirga sediminis]|uniref:SusC/RagA family TonB-linked outer membrane protein n=1 Tax=Fulvivirga sediminis TaxID=2803949 RepID=A0A937FAE3_9BACT|nr:SusC/RagA family TonB-linked outer membrane protein [Fulvivirga sediminis]MBL3657229.1 SusC/RagA family TonB-linked outer membrane protein [Fulvivirga sediminis]
MTKINIKIGIAVLLMIFPMILLAQNTEKFTVKGRVEGADGEAVPGAVIASATDSTQTLTDSQGSFSLPASTGSEITIKAFGFKTQTIIASASMQEITMELDLNAKPVQIAYRNVDDDELSGGVSVVDLSSIMQENYMTAPLDGIEAFAGGYTSDNIWGMDDNLILIDGVPRDIGSIMPTEIDQITILKGVAAVALYGSRGAKGVVSITTKHGKVQKQQVRVRANTGIYTPKSYPKYLGSAEYMTLYNEARVNDGLEPLYSEEDIYHHASGENPYRYPDVDYFAPEYVKKSYNRHDATLEISGGNDLARYYTNVGFWTAGSLLNFGEATDNQTQRFNLRANVDINLSDYITCGIGASAIYYNGRSANADYWSSAATMRPNRFAPLIPISMIETTDEITLQQVANSNHVIDGKYLLGGSQLDQTNAFAGTYAAGYNKYNSRQFQFNTYVKTDLRNLLEGLSFDTNFGVDYQTSYNQSYNYNYAVYEPVWNDYAGYDQISRLIKHGDDSKSGVQNISDSWYSQTIAFSGQFNYLKSIEGSHNVSANLIAAGFQQTESEQYHKTSNVNLGLHLGYDFRKKYFIDFNGALIHSAKLPEGKRKAFSPAATLGWLISEEDFMDDVDFIDHLKLSVSGGILHTDLDIDGYYLYSTLYTQADGNWYSWRDGALNRSTDSRRYENPDLTFARREEVNLGLEMSLFKNLIQFNGTFFVSEITGNVIQPAAFNPNYFVNSWPNSSFLPYVNYNDDRRVGFDFNLQVNQNIDQVYLTFGVAGMYYNSKATKRAELYEDDYQNREGKPLDAIFGLESNGFYTDDQDIANSPESIFGQVSPGDIKYVDQNGDGLIDAKDEVYLGKAGWSGSPFNLGLHISARWKNLTLFALGTGRFGAKAMKNNSYFWVDGDDKYSEIVRGRWTEDTKDSATFPRLTTANSENNFRPSDFWLYSTNRFDLAKVQLSYALPTTIFGKSTFRELTIYVSGANLLTIAPEREILEMNIGEAPQNRFYNLGIKASF